MPSHPLDPLIVVTLYFFYIEQKHQPHASNYEFFFDQPDNQEHSVLSLFCDFHTRTCWIPRFF